MHLCHWLKKKQANFLKKNVDGMREGINNFSFLGLKKERTPAASFQEIRKPVI